jgi:protocatechuate 3,4-dioxygenase beta subunit
MQTARLTRREALQKCAALGTLTLAPSLSLADALLTWEEQERKSRQPTPWNELGPFYKRLAPDTRVLRRPGDPGLPLVVSGQVFDVRGEIIPSASLEIWQTDHLGHYDLDGYRYRAAMRSDNSGKYSFESVMPGHYPDRVCQHIHYLISAPGYKPLTTQLYFATDPVFEGDPDKNYMRDPVLQSRDLVRPVTLAGDARDIHASVIFPIVLERL